MSTTSVVLLAGGTGSRMCSEVPKQYLPLLGKAVARHSFDLFASLKEVQEIVVVCHESYRSHFPIAVVGVPVLFAEPGRRRQDSVYNGLMRVSPTCDMVCIHDSARPLITAGTVLKALEAADQYGAAVVAVPMKATVKQSGDDNLVQATLDRSRLWEIQTPQIIRAALLHEAFRHAHANDLAVTDDVSLVEALGHPVKLVEGDYFNIKITTPEDLIVATHLFRLAPPPSAQHTPAQ